MIRRVVAGVIAVEAHHRQLQLRPERLARRGIGSRASQPLPGQDEVHGGTPLDGLHGGPKRRVQGDDDDVMPQIDQLLPELLIEEAERVVFAVRPIQDSNAHG